MCLFVYYFIPHHFNNPHLLFSVSRGHNYVTIQNQTHIFINFFDNEDLGNHLLQLSQ